MDQDLALSVLGDIMNWDLQRSRREFAWLQLMARFKYDSYHDFVAGVRFIESLADWLQQFEPADREAAYAFLKTKLLYFTAAEMNQLVNHFYPGYVRPLLLDIVAKDTSIPKFRLTAENPAFRGLLRRTLFFGLSDGARIDTFRRSTTGIVSNEQVLLATEISQAKWNQVLEKLRESEGNNARFRVLFLIDDFTATGTTLRGKLGRLWRDFSSFKIAQSHMGEHWTVHVHHYVGTEDVRDKLGVIDNEERLTRKDDWFPRLTFSFSQLVQSNLKLTEVSCGSFWSVIQKYYNSSIETEHTKKGGGKDVRLGFGQCALPLVLEHNCPNNSIPILWADTDDGNGEHAMRPLFRRRQRHTHLLGI